MTEVLTFYALGVKGFGPKLYGTFDGGRVEEFIPVSTMRVVAVKDSNAPLLNTVTNHESIRIE